MRRVCARQRKPCSVREAKGDSRKPMPAQAAKDYPFSVVSSTAPESDDDSEAARQSSPANTPAPCAVCFGTGLEVVAGEGADAHATPTRACERHESGARNPEALGKRFDAGIRQFSNQHSPVRDIRRLNFPSISCPRNPGESFSTTNPPTFPSSSFAQTTLTSAIDTLPIQHLLPFKT